MPGTPYCPLLSAGKDVPVACLEELCMWYIKQLNLCSITVQGYSQAINMGQSQCTSQAQTQKPQSIKQSQEVKQAPQPGLKKQATNPFLDELD